MGLGEYLRPGYAQAVCHIGNCQMCIVTGPNIDMGVKLIKRAEISLKQN